MNQAQKIFVEYRKKAKLTQAQIARVYGISQGTVSQIENGVFTPNAEIILDILKKQKKLK